MCGFDQGGAEALGKRLIKAPKMYMRDTGLLCFLLGFDSPEALVRSQMIGALWETFVLNQLIRHQQYSRTATSATRTAPKSIS